MSELPTSERVGRALNFLAETDAQSGQFTGYVKMLEHKKHIVLSQAKLVAEWKTQAEKEAQAYAGKEYAGWLEEYQNAVTDADTLKAQRATAATLIEVWRSCNANRMQAGQI